MSCVDYNRDTHRQLMEIRARHNKEWQSKKEAIEKEEQEARRQDELDEFLTNFRINKKAILDNIVYLYSLDYEDDSRAYRLTSKMDAIYAKYCQENSGFTSLASPYQIFRNNHGGSSRVSSFSVNIRNELDDNTNIPRLRYLYDLANLASDY